MENKINIAELLKDCPKGMELDCTMFEDCKFLDVETESDRYLIRITTPCGIKYLDKYGCYIISDKAKCVIFPKGETTWDGFVPPCKFKDGDIISNSFATCIFKGQGVIKGTVDYYCGVDDGNFYFKPKNKGHYGYIDDFSLATEEEKQELFDAIKENGFKWNEETKTLEKLISPKFEVGDRIKQIGSPRCYIIQSIEFDRYILHNNQFIRFEDEHIYELVPNKFDISTLKPFDKVLVSHNKGEWHIQFFEKYSPTSKFPFICIGGSVYQKCVPYEGNKHLMDTTNDCDEYYKTW